jgi:hypothetical protein
MAVSYIASVMYCFSAGEVSDAIHMSLDTLSFSHLGSSANEVMESLSPPPDADQARSHPLGASCHCLVAGEFDHRLSYLVPPSKRFVSFPMV